MEIETASIVGSSCVDLGDALPTSELFGSEAHGLSVEIEFESETETEMEMAR